MVPSWVFTRRCEAVTGVALLLSSDPDLFRMLQRGTHEDPTDTRVSFCGRARHPRRGRLRCCRREPDPGGRCDRHDRRADGGSDRHRRHGRLGAPTSHRGRRGDPRAGWERLRRRSCGRVDADGRRADELEYFRRLRHRDHLRRRAGRASLSGQQRPLPGGHQLRCVSRGRAARGHDTHRQGGVDAGESPWVRGVVGGARQPAVGRSLGGRHFPRRRGRRGERAAWPGDRERLGALLGSRTGDLRGGRRTVHGG